MKDLKEELEIFYYEDINPIKIAEGENVMIWGQEECRPVSNHYDKLDSNNTNQSDSKE